MLHTCGRIVFPRIFAVLPPVRSLKTVVFMLLPLVRSMKTAIFTLLPLVRSMKSSVFTLLPPVRSMKSFFGAVWSMYGSLFPLFLLLPVLSELTVYATLGAKSIFLSGTASVSIEKGKFFFPPPSRQLQHNVIK
jgi:hypothetical protein